MNRIEQVFGTSHVVLPVVHPTDRDTTLRSIETVHAAAKGLFLIDQGMSEAGVLALAGEVRVRFPDLWIGVNLLSRAPAEALAAALDACGRIDGIWSDNAGVDERADEQPRRGAQPHAAPARGRACTSAASRSSTSARSPRRISRARPRSPRATWT